MIIPCMNSTSAGDRGGSCAVVDAGNFLLGWPGAPGWTTTGGAACCACAAEKTTPVEATAASSRVNAARARRDPVACLRAELTIREFGTVLGILHGFDEKFVTEY
jgi:hypothetical protein